jgi:hypothetical protein
MIGAFAQGAPALLTTGYSPIPVRFGTRRPLVKHWDRLRSKPMTRREVCNLADRYPQLGLAVAGGYGGLVPIDCDTDDQDIIAAITEVLPEPVVAKAGRRGFTAYYRDTSRKIGGRKFQTPAPERQVLVEVLATGQTMIPPTIHPKTGRPYRWLTSRNLFNTPIGELSEIGAAHLAALEQALRPWVPERPAHTPRLGDEMLVSEPRWQAYARAVLTNEVNALRVKPKNSGRNWQLFVAACKLGKFVHHRVLSRDEFDNALMQACRDNGLWADDGPGACRATLKSGLDKAQADPLPALRPSPRELSRCA